MIQTIKPDYYIKIGIKDILNIIYKREIVSIDWKDAALFLHRPFTSLECIDILKKAIKYLEDE